MADTVKLRNGFEMPTIAFGTWQIPKATTYDRVRDALDSGYRHIDTSPGFRNETEAARAIIQWTSDRKVEVSLILNSKNDILGLEAKIERSKISPFSLRDPAPQMFNFHFPLITRSKK